MTVEEIVKSIKRIKNEITLAKFLSELKLCKNDRVVIYGDSDNMVFDSDDPYFFTFYDFWKLLEENVCRVSDVTENDRRSIFIFMDF